MTEAPAAPEGLKLSVVIPVYNERFLLRGLVERVLAVSVPEIREMELLIVDDGSTDGSREILRELASLHPDRIRYFEQEKNQGKGAALRRGIAAATGDITLFQDADLEYGPARLSARHFIGAAPKIEDPSGGYSRQVSGL